MKRRNALIASTAGLAGLAGMIVLGRPSALGAWGRSPRHDGGAHGGWTRWCDVGAVDRLDEGLWFARAELAIRPDQGAAWDTMAEALRTAAARVASTCSSDSARDLAAPDRLTQAEAMMVTGLGALRDARPAFDALYAVLDDGQRRKLDTMLDHRRA